MVFGENLRTLREMSTGLALSHWTKSQVIPAVLQGPLAIETLWSAAFYENYRLTGKSDTYEHSLLSDKHFDAYDGLLFDFTVIAQGNELLYLPCSIDVEGFKDAGNDGVLWNCTWAIEAEAKRQSVIWLPSETDKTMIISAYAGDDKFKFKTGPNTCGLHRIRGLTADEDGKFHLNQPVNLHRV